MTAVDSSEPVPMRERLLPPIEPLSSLLAEPDESASYRIDRLLPTGGRALLAAQFKAGKTTLRDNLVRALADSDAFLDEFAVEPLAPGRTVVVIDNEMSRGQLRRWLRDQGIRQPERVHVVVLRGRVGSFNLLDPYTRAAWAEALRDVGASFVVFDCLRPVLDALGLDESREAGRFLVAFDALLREAGVDEAALVHHMGHTGERSRGDSRLRDWPDVEWRLVRQVRAGEEPDPSAARFFSAYGRDVDVPEGGLSFDPLSRRLSLTGGSRRDAGARAAIPAVLAVLAEADESLSGRAIEQALRESDHGRDVVRAALRLAVREGTVNTEHGPRNALLHRLNPLVRGSARECAARAEIECASAPIEARTHSLALDEADVSSRAAHSLCTRCRRRLDHAAVLTGAPTCTGCELTEVTS